MIRVKENYWLTKKTTDCKLLEIQYQPSIYVETRKLSTPDHG